ncbi:DUF3379 family protein [Thiomicrorhabdus hydrogeniphila]
MNEIKFRTKLLTDPHQLDEEMLDFLETYPDKKACVQKVREFDKQISDTLDIEIPEGLHARILLNQSYQQNTLAEEETLQPDESASVQGTSNKKNKAQEVTPHLSAKSKLASRSSRIFSGWSTGLAAGIAAFLLFFTVLQTNHSSKAISGDAIVEHILAHIAEDPALMTGVKLPNSEAEMHELFASVGAQLNKPVEGMSYAGMCDVAGQKGLHIVMQENGQPITIMVIPGQQLAAIKAFQKSSYHGEIIPVKGGIVAIIGNSVEQVSIAQSRFFKAVKFT